MAKLSAEDRRNLPDSAFALPDKRAYPITDKGHALAAKTLATRELKRGRLTQADYERIQRKAEIFLKQK